MWAQRESVSATSLCGVAFRSRGERKCMRDDIGHHHAVQKQRAMRVCGHELVSDSRESERSNDQTHTGGCRFA